MVTLYLRPDRPRVLVLGALGLGASAYAVYLEVSEPTSAITQLLLILVLAGVAAAVVNYLFFHYVSVDEDEVRQVQYLGLVRHAIPASQITRIDQGSTRPTLFTFSTIRIRSPHQQIEFIPEMYARNTAREAVQRLHAAGIPIDDTVLRGYAAN